MVVGRGAVDYLKPMDAADQKLDWGFCKQALQRYSRTFAVPISLLPDRLERLVTCAYLLCRIADTIEDTKEWPRAVRETLYRAFLDTLEGAAPEDFVRAVREAGGAPEESELLLGIERVLRIFHEVPQPLRQICAAWVGELTRGMAIYSQRRPGPDGVHCLLSEADLQRYCFYVAGAIGHLLTEAFLSELPQLDLARTRVLRAEAERFGTGLQLVNILRDIRSDLERDACFIPRTTLLAVGLGPRDLADHSKERLARSALLPLFDVAQENLDGAFEYTLALPPEHAEIRNFCLVPLWLAVATLNLCRRDPRLLASSERVKLERSEVQRLVASAIALSRDDSALRREYQKLKAAKFGGTQLQQEAGSP